MHKQQSKELKKSQTAKEFSQILSNSKISILNFSDKPPSFLKEILANDVLIFPIARTFTKVKPNSISIEKYMVEIQKTRELQKEANYRVNVSKSPTSPTFDKNIQIRKKAFTSSGDRKGNQQTTVRSN